MWYDKILLLFRNKELRNKFLIVLGLFIVFRIAANIPIPGIGDFTLYTKESPATNVIKNLMPLLGGVMGAVDPWRPIASLARTVIQLAKPFFNDHIKPYLPGFLKGGAHAVKEFIKSSLKS